MTSRMVPRLRFRGFNKEWKLGQIKDLLNYVQPTKYRVKNTHYISNGIPVLTANKTFILGYTSETHPFTKHCIIFDDFTLDNKLVTFSFMIKSSAIKILVPKNSNLYFDYGLLNVQHLVSKEHKRHYISLVQNLNVRIATLSEQHQIGSFFAKLDRLISLQRQKIALLKKLKRGYLQKIFPRKGESVPRLRFKGFSGGWKEVRIKDISKHVGGTALEKYFNKNGDYKVISIGSYGLNGQYIDQGLRVSLNHKTKAKIINKGDLAMVLNDKTKGRILGKTLLINKNNMFIFNQRTERIIPNHHLVDSKFLYYTTSAPYFRSIIKKLAQGGTQIYINFKSVAQSNVFIPSLLEQKKIGYFFARLDNIISAQNNKINSLKRLKKSYLQKMFC